MAEISQDCSSQVWRQRKSQCFSVHHHVLALHSVYSPKQGGEGDEILVV